MLARRNSTVWVWIWVVTNWNNWNFRKKQFKLLLHLIKRLKFKKIFGYGLSINLKNNKKIHQNIIIIKIWF